MKSLVFALLLLPLAACYAEPTSPNTTLTFYVTDDNLNINHRGIDIVSTAGLVDFTLNGIPIPGPSTMIETAVDSATFQIQLTLPSTVNGRPLQNGDVVVMTYHMSADYSGNPTTITQSRVLNIVPSSPISSPVQTVGIGHDFTLRMYAPNFNLDSFTPDDIPLSMIEFRMGGVSTTLADSAFHVNTGALRETGPNTDIFEATFKIPKEVDGFSVGIGSTLEFRFVDTSLPAPSESSVFVRVGSGQVAEQNPRNIIMSPNITVHTTNASGTKVNYLNSTALKGLVGPVCFPSSGSIFPIGSTTVSCSAKDQLGNSVMKSFTITVNKQNVSIPYWIKKLATYWCHGDISDSDFHFAIQYLISNNVISVLDATNTGEPIDKSNFCLWSEGKVGDNKVANLFSHLVR